MTKTKQNNYQLILGIETSCDDTGIALVTTGGKLIGEIKFSSAPIQAAYGGVVPEIAARVHAKKILQLTNQLLTCCQVTTKNIVAIAYTKQPGLIGCLLVGQVFAKTLSWLWNKPLIPVNHLVGHIFSVGLTTPIHFPFLALVASGKTTALYYVESYVKFTLLNSTVDDAIGEVYDKVGRVMGLTYPAGPKIDQLYNEQLNVPQLAKQPKASNPFSYSGIKTAAINYWKQCSDWDEKLKCQLLATALQNWVITSLIRKINYYAEKWGVKNLAIIGGVGANQLLRKKISELKYQVMLVDLKYATDNGAMIAYYGAMLLQQNCLS